MKMAAATALLAPMSCPAPPVGAAVGETTPLPLEIVPEGPVDTVMLPGRIGATVQEGTGSSVRVTMSLTVVEQDTHVCTVTTLVASTEQAAVSLVVSKSSIPLSPNA
jgi:hypothetical protein